MGMFDEVVAKCPNCGDTVVFQSKAGVCELKSYPLCAMPQEVAVALNGDSEECEACGTEVIIDYPLQNTLVTMVVRTDYE